MVFEIPVRIDQNRGLPKPTSAKKIFVTSSGGFSGVEELIAAIASRLAGAEDPGLNQPYDAAQDYVQSSVQQQR